LGKGQWPGGWGVARIYISSTFKDLEQCRKAICAQLRRLAGHEVVAMEEYVACDERPMDKCLEDVDKCDVYIGIFAWRYGFVPKDGNPEGKSVTELEYRCAKELHKECLLFLLDEDPETLWRPAHCDNYTQENGAGARIKALREELKQQHTVTFFTTADQLASLVSAAIQVWEKKPAHNPSVMQEQNAQLHSRELQDSVLLAYAPMNHELAIAYADVLAKGLGRKLVLSNTALFVDSDDGFSALEETAIRCAAAFLLLTPAALDQLSARSKQIGCVVAMLAARLGPVGALICGGKKPEVPTDWGLAEVFEAGVSTSVPTGPDPVIVPAVQSWLDSKLPPRGSRTVGLPVTVLSMTFAECQALVAKPTVIGDRLGNEAQRQFERVTTALASAGVNWQERYGPSRTGWQPFGPEDKPIGNIVEEIVERINRRKVEKVLKFRIKIQWYPFDVLKAQLFEDYPCQLQVYGNIAQAGCVLLVDEMSLFHPDLHESFRNSPLYNNPHVSVVTLSPFDPHPAAIEQLLDAEPRRKLAGAFARFAKDYDPQCELAVGGPLRLRRWLHCHLPEAVANLNAPPPDPRAMLDFFSAAGVDQRQSGGSYLWAGGGLP
jgi:hypothetical protein